MSKEERKFDRTIIHYFPETGRMRQWGTFHAPHDFEGLPYAVVDTPHSQVDGERHVVDLASVGVGDDGVPVCRLAERPDHEVAEIAEQRKIGRLRLRRNAILAMTDSQVGLPVDHPQAGLDEEPIKRYRQALRDLGQYRNGALFIAHWPLRPDGGDDIADLRPSAQGAA